MHDLVSSRGQDEANLYMQKAKQPSVTGGGLGAKSVEG